jgi:hypothetical protein
MQCDRCAGLVVAEQFIGGAPPMEDGSMAKGGVSIAVRSTFPFAQARYRSYGVRREAEKIGKNAVRRTQRFVAMSSDRIIDR